LPPKSSSPPSPASSRCTPSSRSQRAHSQAGSTEELPKGWSNEAAATGMPQQVRRRDVVLVVVGAEVLRRQARVAISS
jgi:hypothetical protein